MDEFTRHPRPTATSMGAPGIAPGTAGNPFSTAPSSRWDRMRGPLLTAGVVGGLSLALHFRDPHASGSWGMCPWLVLTGHYCPGCGVLRAVNDLTNGDVVGAASSNLVFVLMVPLLVFWWVRWAERSWSGSPRPVASRQYALVWISLATVVAVSFGVLRNLPGGSWLAP